MSDEIDHTDITFTESSKVGETKVKRKYTKKEGKTYGRPKKICCSATTPDNTVTEDTINNN